MIGTLTCAALLTVPLAVLAAEDPLPSWNDGAAKTAIIGFVAATTTKGGPDFSPVPERIAAFDNDGTLWTEATLYSQAYFTLDRVRAMAPDHPEWADQQPFKAAVEGDLKALAALGKEGLVTLVTATHSGMTAAEFNGIVADWIASARHPTFNRPIPNLPTSR
ncbi:hypothetical protein PY32053_04234 (plasmid) [Paracoccus yeei]|uniref:Haloacid dehalogenase-like hydrolase n=1 Tax=Paracoccus yeei TaxID=147645 RepID=A0A386UTR9_9RHOB|nr:hypothetical protein PY32053_04234 [Paracoccus yeei]